MLRQAQNLKGCEVRAQDGPIGRVDDLLFEDEGWRVRYLVVGTGGLLPGEKVLVAPDAVEEISEAMPASVGVRLTRDQIKGSLPAGADPPVGARKEEAQRAYLGVIPYWGAFVEPYPLYDLPGGPSGSGERGDPHLRSANEVRGYAVSSKDRTFGHVEDFMVDDGGWEIRYLIADTRDWLPGRKVPIPSAWVQGISWAGAEVEVDLTEEEIRDAPGWRPGTLIDRVYETELHAHYGRTPYWLRRHTGDPDG